MNSFDVQPIAIEFIGVTKQFGWLKANDSVSFAVPQGTIHGVVGENGAGKSTAMKLLYGMQQPDAGKILVRGKACSWKSPRDAIAAGIGMVHQHFMLAGPQSVLDNIILGDEPDARGWRWAPRALRAIDRKGARAKLEALASKLKFEIPWDTPVEHLPVGVQQRVEILKLLYRDTQILILDEPTAVLTPHEKQEFFELLRALKSEGRTILIITHKLKEILALTDHVTVMRGGKVSGHAATATLTESGLAEMMVGRALQSVSVRDAGSTPQGTATLSVQELSGPKLKRVSLEVRPGEIVGIAGVEGNGQSDLLRAILFPQGKDRTTGSIRIAGQDVTRMGVAAIKHLGVGVVTEDRLKDGLLPLQNLEQNYLLGLEDHPRFQKKGFLKSSVLARETTQVLEDFDVRPRDSSWLAGRLSGGNQQKLILARELAHRPQLLLIAQPTRGVDVGAIEFLHGQILKARSQGMAILLISSELEEILALSDRILVMFEGQVVAEVPQSQASESRLGQLMGGASE